MTGAKAGPVRELRAGVSYVGAVDWDRRLFDELIPLPGGTSYNSYLVRGSDKTAVIDTVDPTKTDVLFANLARCGIRSIDYVIAHHAEQDHSGSLPMVLEAYPGAKIVTNAKCRGFLIDLMPLKEEDFLVVDEGETISLGDRTLEFILAPWVHWPETMFTLLREEKLLFTCDFLGSHLATSDLFAGDEREVYRTAKRYYAEIMMPFRTSVRKHLERVRGLDVTMAAPSHGPVHDKPDLILSAYEDWSSDEVKNEVVLPYVSMHGSTQRMVDHFTDALIARGITVKPFHLTRTDLGELASALVDAATVVIGSPTILAGVHPVAAHAAIVANALRPKTRFVSVIGSYGWGGKTVEQLAGMLGHLKVEVLEPVLSKGYPQADDFAALDRLADDILARHQEAGAA